jgi:hypothetical protein
VFGIVRYVDQGSPASGTEEFAALPNDLQEKIISLGEPDPERFATRPIPALGGESIVALHKQDGGDARIRQFLVNVMGKFG